MKITTVAVVCLTLSGCATSYTSITPSGEGGYYVTRTKSGFFRTSSTIYVCEGHEKSMACTQTGRR